MKKYVLENIRTKEIIATGDRDTLMAKRAALHAEGRINTFDYSVHMTHESIMEELRMVE